MEGAWNPYTRLQLNVQLLNPICSIRHVVAWALAQCAECWILSYRLGLLSTCDVHSTQQRSQLTHCDSQCACVDA